MKILILGLILIFLATVYPLCWAVSFHYRETAGSGIRQFIDSEIINTERAGYVLSWRKEGVHIHTALVDVVVPSGNPAWKMIGIPASILSLITGIVLFQAAYEDRRRQNKT